MVECIITKVCEETPEYDWLDYNNRESVRSAYKSKGAKMPDDTQCLYLSSKLIEIYRLINPIRNYLVHLSRRRAEKTSVTTKINTLKKAIADMKAEIRLHAKFPYDL